MFKSLLIYIFCAVAAFDETAFCVRIDVTLGHGKSTQGSGVIMLHRNTPMVLTCHHVVAGARRIRIVDGFGNTYPKYTPNKDPRRRDFRITVVEVMPDHDLAWLRVPDLEERPTVAALEELNADMENPEALSIRGYPQGAKLPKIKAKLARSDFVPANEIQVDYFIDSNHQLIFLVAEAESTGLSGAPVFYQDQVVGIFSGTIKETAGAGLTWAIPIRFRNHGLHFVEGLDSHEWPRPNFVASDPTKLRSEVDVGVSLQQQEDSYVTTLEKTARLLQDFTTLRGTIASTSERLDDEYQRYDELSGDNLREQIFEYCHSEKLLTLTHSLGEYLKLGEALRAAESDLKQALRDLRERIVQTINRLPAADKGMAFKLLKDQVQLLSADMGEMVDLGLFAIKDSNETFQALLGIPADLEIIESTNDSSEQIRRAFALAEQAHRAAARPSAYFSDDKRRTQANREHTTMKQYSRMQMLIGIIIDVATGRHLE